MYNFRSLIKIKNNKGNKLPPWDTPDDTRNLLDILNIFLFISSRTELITAAVI
jgi:hypothetical protein